jgi:uncharacterized membrane protein YeaQ/YmgE (transglycosylase-associated protein family)
MGLLGAIILTVLLGALVGWLASIIMRRDAQQGAVANILVGIGGAIIGGIVSRMIGGSKDVSPWIGFNFPDVIWALVGAIVLCALLNMFQRRTLR